MSFFGGEGDNLRRIPVFLLVWRRAQFFVIYRFLKLAWGSSYKRVQFRILTTKLEKQSL